MKRGLLIPQKNYPDVTHLSQCARLAVALHLFQGYCDCRGLINPKTDLYLNHLWEIDRYLDHLWEFVGLIGDGEAFGRWVQRKPPLTHAGPGDPLPAGFNDFLAAAGALESEFLQVLS
jgi:hypothetical protein